MVSAILFKKKYLHLTTVFLSLVIISVLGPYLLYNINFMGRIYPNIYVSGIDIGGKLPKEAVSLLSEKINPPKKINLIGQTQTFNLNVKEINTSYDFDLSVERAYNLTRTGNLILDTIKGMWLITNKDNIGLATNIDEAKLSELTSVIAKQVTVDPIYPSIEEKDGTIKVNRGVPGSQIDTSLLRAVVGHNLSYTDGGDITIPFTVAGFTLTDQEAETAKIRGEKYLNKNLSANFDSQKFTYKENSILKFVSPSGGYNHDILNDTASSVASVINRDLQNPKFEFNGVKVAEFLPALDGIALENQKFKDLLVDNLDKLAESTEKNFTFDIPVKRTPPSVSTDKINNLGIKELIGHGESTYYHSISGRIFNINLAASKINGILIKPGDTFSFNQTLGDVSKITGYKEAYIISEGRTVLGDGGGVCQASTTLFRSALNAGLPIVERSAHAYRVGYYEQNSPPGLDATVYSPSPDLKFRNDTPGYLLIQAKNNPKKSSLVFEIYGTNDGRTSSISKPTISNIKPALPTVYQDDPTLPIGTSKQVDYAASGAKVVFNYSVTRAGEQIYKKTFVSNYQPWAAVYLKGAAPAI